MVTSIILYPTKETDVEVGTTEISGGIYLDLESGGVVLSLLNCPPEFLEELHFQVGVVLRESLSPGLDGDLRDVDGE